MQDIVINVAIHGFGKVGQLLKELIETDQNLRLAAVIDPLSTDATHKSFDAIDLKQTPVDVVVDFSNASAVEPLVRLISETAPDVALVIATSGWQNQKAEIEKLITSSNLLVLYGANFALGTVLFIKIIKQAAEHINTLSTDLPFDTSILETHHNQKADMPSGTAKHLAEQLIEVLDNKDTTVEGSSKQVVAPNELHVASLRSGSNVGAHSVIFDSEFETITMTQQTKDRRAYARGALIAAQWLLKQKPGKLYYFDNYLTFVKRR